MTLPSFSGHSAFIIHRADRNRDALEAQLRRIGLNVQAHPPTACFSRVAAEADVIFFDADSGCDSLFSWGRSPPPVPLVALLGSEAPGRIEWALSHFACAFMTKPIGSSGAFQALVVAHHLHGEIQRMRHSVGELSERLRARPLVVRAVLEVMRQHRLDETQALDRLRRAAMQARMTVEALAATLVARPVLVAHLSDERTPFAVGRDNGRRTSKQI
ncbi:MAG TPA: ANTAR domain-containing protein [Acidocella sp.]|jgi:AmiR/NasT family two-component response regulator|uniref:ANTAR domain-containing response regulator n=1 Tax=Acidocella sp. TaxID=50710 RepID=UPI002D179963|nr:ANTAR domain-containing protein [Acidocella sp.]HVE23524.1 ANTAR domain-containing protein [Acidocella sp.]